MKQEDKRRAGGGGRLGRSETVTVRLDPKLNYLAEITARAQRRTKSSLIEAALAEALNVIRIDPRPTAQVTLTVAQVAEELWHVDEPERLRRLVAVAPHLMTFEEQNIWNVISKNPYFWLGDWKSLNADEEYYATVPDPSRLWMKGVELAWDLVKRVAAGEASADDLPQTETRRPKQKTFAYYTQQLHSDEANS